MKHVEQLITEMSSFYRKCGLLNTTKFDIELKTSAYFDMKTPWRNGSASDSRSEGCVFKSRRGQSGCFEIERYGQHIHETASFNHLMCGSNHLLLLVDMWDGKMCRNGIILLLKSSGSAEI